MKTIDRFMRAYQESKYIWNFIDSSENFLDVKMWRNNAYLWLKKEGEDERAEYYKPLNDDELKKEIRW